MASIGVFANPVFAYQLGEVVELSVALDAQTDEAVSEKQEDATESDAKEDDGPVTDTAQVVNSSSSIQDKYIRFHMRDGSVIGGVVELDTLDVKTEFGMLQIPIESISKFYPGLDSIPALSTRITQLVEELGDKEFDVREQARRELSAMGLQLRHEINRFDDGGSVERKKHLAALRKEIEEQQDDLDDFDESVDQRALMKNDSIVTKDFSIAGNIQQPQFRMTSKYGQLTIKLSDIRMADRSFNEPQSALRKSLSVSGTAFFQKKPASTKIRVNRGDKISIRASGIVQWTNWSTSSGPDGISNQGQWNGINSGCLVARIGDDGKFVKIGSKHEFTAKKSGVLYLGVAMRDNYAKNSGYKWDGKYDVKVVVKPTDK